MPFRFAAMMVGAVLLVALGHATVSGQAITRRQQPPRLTVAVEPLNAPVAIGQSAALSIRITPNPGIHVYAPGNKDYIPVAVTVTPTAGLAMQTPAFPKAEDFFFGPLAETVKAYSKSFVVTVPMRAESSLRSHPATAGIADVPVSGTVSYQACDEKVCFPPQSASFEGRLQVRLKGH
jgi:DsbC/DsbD-like thiol-disulfide interchange protein